MAPNGHRLYGERRSALSSRPWSRRRAFAGVTSENWRAVRKMTRKAASPSGLTMSIQSTCRAMERGRWWTRSRAPTDATRSVRRPGSLNAAGSDHRQAARLDAEREGLFEARDVGVAELDVAGFGILFHMGKPRRLGNGED